jgi:hypothetical protein
MFRHESWERMKGARKESQRVHKVGGTRQGKVMLIKGSKKN